ncbi:hypothetical protein LT40_18005 [Pseudomonas rhizosphaerae]|uniref:Uncharacterized protein n=1 Tax=Pseudomonas rhizosphaerae TaxID=216142 RepID=A0A089Z0A5_9PSED|nr:Ig-like domain repeat protein [Pseudomonas rhizosphaerae]AIS19190.1 hypothetical protein LT40_18005 [Pseudomonas rhizosphaerae]
MTTLNNALRLLQLQIRQSQSPDVGAFGAAPYHPGTPTLPAPQVPALLVHNGLNKNDLHDPAVPVAVQVVLQIGMLENDDLTLYLGDTAVAVETLRPEHLESGIVTFYLLPSVFPQDGQVTLHYHHKVPPSDSFSVSRNAGPFLVKQSVPGNPDPDPSTPYVNEHLTPPTGIPATVTPGQPLTVTIPRYANIAENDEIVLHWSNQEIRKTVNAAEASTPSMPLTITVSADIIDNTPGLGLIVRYEIHDTVMNWSLYSLEAHADVDVPGSLHVPTLPQTNDYDQLDMDDLAGADVTVYIPVTGNNMPAGTQGTLTWTGQPILGPQLTYTAAFRVEASASRVTVKVPNAKAAALAGSSVTVYYDAIIGGQNKRSHRVTATVIGQPVTLAQPRLTGVTGNTFNPDIVTGSHQEVIVPAYGFMASGQTIQLHWKGQTASGTPMYTTVNHAVTSNTPQDVSLLIDKAFAITLGTGRVLEVYYEVTAQGVSYLSPTLQLTVVGIPSNLPKPTTEPVFANGEIDPGAIVDAIKVVVEPNSTLAPGDLLTVKWLGRSNASITLTDQAFPSSGNLEIRIGKTPYIDGNTNGYVDVSYEARRNGQPVGSSQVLQLHVGAAAELPWPLPKVVDATNGEVSTWQPVKPGTSYESNTATVVVSDSRILAGDTVAIIWRLPGGTDLTIPWMLAGAGEGRVPVPATVLVRSLGQTVQVGYVVFRGPASDLVGNSALMNLQVGTLPANELSELIILEAANSGAGPEFDVSRLMQDATIRVGRWPMIEVAQPVWLTLTGTRQDGSAWSKELLAATPTDATWVSQGRKTVNVTMAELKELKDGASLTVTFKVALDGSPTESDAVSFAPRVYTVKSVPDVRPVITTVRDSDGEIAHGGTTYNDEVVVMGTAAPSQQVQLLDGSTQISTVTADSNGKWSFTITNLAIRSYSITARAVYGSGLVSDPRNFSYYVLTREYADFESNHTHGWIGLPSNIISVGGSHVLSAAANGGPGMAGSISKTLTHLKVGGNYRWSAKLGFLTTQSFRFTKAIVVNRLGMNGVATVVVTNGNMTTLSGTFKAVSSTEPIYVYVGLMDTVGTGRPLQAIYLDDSLIELID